MTIDKKITMDAGWWNRTSRAIRTASAAVMLAYVTTVAGGCLLDSSGLRSGGDGQVGTVDGGTQPSDLDHPEEDGGVGDAGTDGDAGCAPASHELPMNVYNKIEFDINTSDLETDILNYRLPSTEGGLTFGQLFDHDTAMGYGEHGFQDLYQSEQGLRDALANDLSAKVSELICSAEPTEVNEAVSQLFREVFDDGDDRMDFRLSGDNSVYFTRAVGGDGVERDYMVMVGAVVPTDGQTSGTPTVLYLSGMSETFAFIQDQNSEGI